MASGTQWVALLRGINVGGKNLVKMDELRAAFEQMGFDEVATYIASGNVLFRAPRQPSAELAARIESELTRRFGIELRIVLQSEAQLRAVVAGAPPGFGAKTERCDVVFLRKPLTPAKAFAAIETREGVDRAWQGKGVLYFSRVASKAARSKLSKIATKPEYQNMTIRSWSTTQKLLALLDARAST